MALIGPRDVAESLGGKLINSIGIPFGRTDPRPAADAKGAARLSKRRPIDLLTTGIGADIVDQQLARIDSGVYV